MSFPAYIAKRYLFSKKSQNAINIISLISVCGVAIGTLALVCVLSVYNGFEGIVQSMFSQFDPPLEITPSEGKVFEADSIRPFLEQEEIADYCEVIEDNALIRYADKQVPVVLKGVSNHYAHINHIDSILVDGRFVLEEGSIQMAVAGIGLAHTLGAGVHYVEPLWLYVPRREGRVNMLRPEQAFNRDYVYLSGVFMVQQEKYDQSLLLIPLSLARELYEYPTQVSSIELSLQPGVRVEKFERKLQAQLGDKFQVKNQYEQQEEFFKMLQVEKWVTYLILTFILLIAVFNIIGSLSMLMIDKQDDVKILMSLGATRPQVSHIFLLEGWMISIVGAVVGVVLGLLLCYLQAEFGWIGLGNSSGNFFVNAYPVQVVWSDIFIIFVTVLGLGFLAALYPSRQYLSK